MLKQNIFHSLRFFYKHFCTLFYFRRKNNILTPFMKIAQRNLVGYSVSQLVLTFEVSFGDSLVSVSCEVVRFGRLTLGVVVYGLFVRELSNLF